MAVEATVVIVHASATPSAMVTAIVALTMMQDAMRPRVLLLLALPLPHVRDFMETAAQQPTGCTWGAALRK